MIEGIEQLNVGNVQRVIQMLAGEHRPRWVAWKGDIAQPANSLVADKICEAFRQNREPDIPMDSCAWSLEGLIVQAVEPNRLVWSTNAFGHVCMMFYDDYTYNTPGRVSVVPAKWLEEQFGASYENLQPAWHHRSLTGEELVRFCEANDTLYGRESWGMVRDRWIQLRDARLSG